MWQIKVNGILMPTIFWSYRDALDASYIEKARGYSNINAYKIDNMSQHFIMM